MNADPDRDGQTNLLEFAFGSSPDNHRSAYIQKVTVAGGQFQVCLTMPDYDTTGLLYDVEASPDLQEWTRVRRIPGGPSVPDAAVICADPFAAEGGAGFVRIKVTMTEP
jgi:hypothetical protein